MAAGDIMLDAGGNIILAPDGSGNILLDDGAGNDCCCGCPTCQTDAYLAANCILTLHVILDKGLPSEATIAVVLAAGGVGEQWYGTGFWNTIPIEVFLFCYNPSGVSYWQVRIETPAVSNDFLSVTVNTCCPVLEIYGFFSGFPQLITSIEVVL